MQDKSVKLLYRIKREDLKVSTSRNQYELGTSASIFQNNFTSQLFIIKLGIDEEFSDYLIDKKSNEYHDFESRLNEYVIFDKIFNFKKY